MSQEVETVNKVIVNAMPAALVAGDGKSLNINGTVDVSGNVTVTAESIALDTTNLEAKIQAQTDIVATQTTLAQIKAKTDNIDVALSTRTKPADTQTVAGTVGVTFPTNFTHESALIKIIDYDTLVGKGDVANHTIGQAIGNGSNGTITTNVFSILSNAVVTQPSVNTWMKIVSTSAQDGVGGTGIQQVTIKYLTSAWVNKTEVITMNGVTPVNMSNQDVYRINELYANKVGSAGVAVGTITLVDQATGLIKYAQIDPTIAFFERAIHYVSAGKTCVLTSILIGSSTTGGVILRIFSTDEDGSGNRVTRSRYSTELAVNTSFIPFKNVIQVSNPNNTNISIGLAVKGMASNQSCTGTLQFYEEDI